MRSDKMPTRREGEASSETAVLKPPRKPLAAVEDLLAHKKNTRKNKSLENINSRARILRRKAACALGNRGLWTAQTPPKQPHVVFVVRGSVSWSLRSSVSPEPARAGPS